MPRDRGVTWRYPAGSLDDLIASDAVTEPTWAVLVVRGEVADRPAFFDRDAFAVLTAVVGRLAPWPELAPAIATAIDARLVAGRGNGWRYAELAGDGEVYRVGLALIDGGGFRACSPAAQDALLRGVQSRPDTARFFEELLTEVTELAFAQTAALAAIGYSGLADAPGWRAVGLNERDAREAIENG